MNTFLKTGIYTEGCIIPMTTEDPFLIAVLDDFSENFRINIYAGSHYITSVTMQNYKQMCNDVSSMMVNDRHGKYVSNIHSLIQEQLFYVYARMHNVN